MIASVSGVVSALGGDWAVVDVGGVGLQVHCTPATAASLRLGERTHLATSLVVREDALTLFGFADADERAVFELLQSATGVGPRIARAALAVHGPATLRRAIATEDIATLVRVPGIGRKGAQRIVLELKDKVGLAPPAEAADAPTVPAPSAPHWSEQVKTALVGLGYSAREAEDAVAAVDEPADDQPEVSVVLRDALRRLSRS